MRIAGISSANLYAGKMVPKTLRFWLHELIALTWLTFAFSVVSDFSRCGWFWFLGFPGGIFTLQLTVLWQRKHVSSLVVDWLIAPVVGCLLCCGIPVAANNSMYLKRVADDKLQSECKKAKLEKSAECSLSHFIQQPTNTALKPLRYCCIQLCIALHVFEFYLTVATCDCATDQW